MDFESDKDLDQAKSDISMESISSASLSERESGILFDISSGSLSEIESGKLQHNIRDNRLAETILRKNITNLKDIFRNLIDTVPHEFQSLLDELETRVGQGDKAEDIAAKLGQLSEDLLEQLRPVTKHLMN
uniref:Uncharacterized protein n=1 Tax=Panagrolaimus davidi TaxID=227884 RepID=A0A914P575_9BILA